MRNFHFLLLIELLLHVLSHKWLQGSRKYIFFFSGNVKNYFMFLTKSISIKISEQLVKNSYDQYISWSFKNTHNFSYAIYFKLIWFEAFDSYCHLRDIKWSITICAAMLLDFNFWVLKSMGFYLAIKSYKSSKYVLQRKYITSFPILKVETIWQIFK